MRRIADIAETLLMFLGRGFALSARGFGGPDPAPTARAAALAGHLVPDERGCPAMTGAATSYTASLPIVIPASSPS